MNPDKKALENALKQGFAFWDENKYVILYSVNTVSSDIYKRRENR